MDTQDSSSLKPLSEVRIDISPEGATTNKASQDGRGPIEECTTTSKASQDGHGSIDEFHKELSSEGTTIYKASQQRRRTNPRITNQPKTKDPSSKGTTNAKASQESLAPSEVTQTAKVNEDYRELFKAAMEGDWEAAERIFKEDRKAMTANVITVEDKSKSVLEVAIWAAQDQFVENLVKCLKDENFPFSNSCASEAARKGRIRMIKALANETNHSHALRSAVLDAPMHKDVIWYLVRCTKMMPRYKTRRCLIVAGHLDISLHLAHRYPRLETSKLDENMKLLKNLARMKSYFHSGARLNFWEKLIYTCIPLCLIETSSDNFEDLMMAPAFKRFKISLWNVATKLVPFIKRIGESKWRHKCSLDFADLALTGKATDMKTPQILKFLLNSDILLNAASHGISEIIELCLKHFPELMWEKNIPNALMVEVVNGRHVELFRLMNAYNRIPKLSDSILVDRNLMEAVVLWSPRCLPTDVSGTAFLMQRELQWYKVLEDRSDPFFKSLKFKVEEDPSNPSFKSPKLTKIEEMGGKTYREVFVAQRQDLLKDAGQWMNNTSSSCSLVATLIITIAFAAAFTVPGGNDGSIGIPIFLKKDSFMVFAVADALALFSSVTATLMFLAILTSRYAIEDFLHSLPRKMVLGLTFLFLSLAFMLVAFASALTIILSDQLKWIYIPITLLAAIPSVLFLILQLPLYVEMVESTFCPRLHRPLKLRK